MYDKIDRMKSALPWLFGSHYKMERFGIMFFILVMCLVTSFGLAYKKSIDLNNIRLGDQVMYTTSFRMSRSYTQANVIDVRVSEDNQRCFVLMQWVDSEGKPSVVNVNTDADKYQLFLTGSDGKGDSVELLSSPIGSFYSFGASGYFGVYLVDTNGFPSQILNLTIRSFNDYQADGEPIADAEGDPSFLKYDQARIYFNPGGASAKTASCLESRDMTAYSIYTSFFSEEKEASIKESMQESLNTMQKSFLTLQNDYRAPENAGLQIPLPPSDIGELDSVMIMGQSSDVLFEMSDDETPIPLNLRGAVELPGALTFDWRNLDLKTGYIEEVLSQTGYNDISDLLSDKQIQSSNSQFTTNVSWYTKAGENYQYSLNETDPESMNRNNAITAVTTAWNNYYKAKFNYQCVYPLQLLQLEKDARDVVTFYSQNNDVMICY